MRDLGVRRFWLVGLLTVCSGCGVAESFPRGEPVGQSAAALSVATQLAELGAADPIAEAGFGAALALDGDRLVVGAPGDEAAYVFLRQGDAWSQEAKLVAGSGKRELGHAVAITGDTVVVGAPKDGELGAEAGAAHVFVREQGAWVEKRKLVASDAAVGDLFGSAVAISGDEILVSGTQTGGFAPGFAHVYQGAGAAWTEEIGALVPSVASFADAFGVSAAMSGDAALVGAYFTSLPGIGETAGTAYVFRRVDGVWTQEAQLVGSQEAPSALTGRAVALDGDTALVAAPSLVSVAQGTGMVFVFRRGAQGWEEEGQLLAGDGGSGDELGISVAVSGDTAVVGSDRFQDGQGPGAVYVFTRTGHTWIRQLRIDAEGGLPGDRLGSAVAVSGDTVIAGARHAAGAAGAAYAYRVKLANGELCTSAAACESGFCVDGVCCDTACGGGDPDDCQACSTAHDATANGTCLVLEPDVICRAPSAACAKPVTCDGQSTLCPAEPAPGPAPTCPPPDAGAPTDAGAVTESPSTSDGCSLRPAKPGPGLSGIFALLLLSLAARRSRPGAKSAREDDFSPRR